MAAPLKLTRYAYPISSAYRFARVREPELMGYPLYGTGCGS